MHATRDTNDVIKRNRVGGRVMRGVRRFELFKGGNIAMSDLLERQRESEHASIIRSMIEHENNLQNYRLTWLMTVQGLLLAGLGFAWDKKDTRELVGVFCLLGILVSISSWSVLRLSGAAYQDLLDWWKNNKPPNYDGPPIIGHQSRYPFVLWILRPWRALPWIFVLGWIFVFIFNLRRA
jgi:hypothetical protein